MAELPSGTVSFLFTDVEGSTRLWDEHPEAMRAASARHDEILRDAIESHHGYVVKTTGDGFHAAFATASDAVDAAVGAQLALAGEAAHFVEHYRAEHDVDDAAHTLGPEPRGPETERAWRVASEQLRTFCAALGTLKLADQAIEPALGLEIGIEI